MDEQLDAVLPAISVEADPHYVLGFPILLAVTLHNETVDTDYLDLPELGLIFPLDSLAVEIAPLDGISRTRLGPSFEFRERNMFRTELMAGQAQRALIDLSHFGQALSPGHYQVVVSIFDVPGVSRSSAPVNVEFIEPSAAERSEAARLRRLGLRPNAIDSGSWRPFLTNNWNTVSLSQPLGERAARQLALHLALHRAAYGPEPLDRSPVAGFQRLQQQGTVISAEAAASAYELLAARGSGAELEAARSRLLRSWPDLTARIEQIEQGEGILATLRRSYGVEKEAPPPPGTPPPYTEPGDP